VQLHRATPARKYPIFVRRRRLKLNRAEKITRCAGHSRSRSCVRDPNCEWSRRSALFRFPLYNSLYNISSMEKHNELDTFWTNQART
ncbi:unnamed protein product, partial [Allacma fusca]